MTYDVASNVCSVLHLRSLDTLFVCTYVQLCTAFNYGMLSKIVDLGTRINIKLWLRCCGYDVDHYVVTYLSRFVKRGVSGMSSAGSERSTDTRRVYAL